MPLQFSFGKGYSTSCRLSAVIVAALADVAAFLGTRLELCKVARCSVPLASMADALSKGAFVKFNGLLLQEGLTPVFVGSPPSPALLSWVADPRPDWELGRRVVEELRLAGLGPSTRS